MGEYLWNNSKDKYKGWHTDTNTILMQEPFKKDGMPLIPYEQQLKIAITDPDVDPLDEENNVTPTANPTLNLAEKAVWYCVEIINDDFGNNNMHLVLEQGCGYAFDYSDAGKSNVENPEGYAVLPKLFRKICEENFGITENNYANFLNYIYDESASDRTQLEPNEFYEIQYRIMRLFNDLIPNIPSGRSQLNQVPGVNESPIPLSFDQNTDAYLQEIFDSMVNQ